MASLSGNLLGEPFKDYVNDQIVARQKVHGKKNRTLKEIQYLNSRNAWIKLASGVFIEQERLDLLKKNAKKAGGSNTLLEGVNEGMELALQNVLFNGLSSFGVINKNDQADNTETLQREDQSTKFRQSQRSGIKGSNRAYGVGGTSEYGYSPMPGIIDANIRDLNRGSIKKATINLKCHNRAQFDVIDVLYMRLGYTVLLEWGNDKYLNGLDSQGNGKLAQMGTTLADKEWWEKNGSSYVEALPAIEALRRKYHGNYDGIFGTVSNFSWTFNDDGSYDIKLELISQGDIIESLKANLPPHEKGEENTLDSYQKIDIGIIKNKGAINNEFFYGTLYKGNPGLESILDTWWEEKMQWGWGFSRNLLYGSETYPTEIIPYYIANLSGWDFPNSSGQDKGKGALNAGRFKSSLPDSGETKGMAAKANEVIVNGKSKDGGGIVEKALRRCIQNLLTKAITKDLTENPKKPKYAGEYIMTPDLTSPLGNLPTRETNLRKSKGDKYSYNEREENVEFYFKKGYEQYTGRDLDVNIALTLEDVGSRDIRERQYFQAWLLVQLFGLYNLKSWDDVWSLIKNEYRIYFVENLVGGGPESVFDENNPTEDDDQDEDAKQAELAQQENENELEEGRFKNKTTDYLYNVRKWIDGISMEAGYPITIPGASEKEQKITIGSIANPPVINGQDETNKKFLKKWRDNVGYPTYTSTTDFTRPADVVKLKVTPLDKQFYIRLGTLLGFIEEKIIPRIETDSSLPPMLKIDTNSKKNICYAIDNMLSLNPNKTIVRVDNFYMGIKDNNGANITGNIYEGLDTFVEKTQSGVIYGNIMNVYFNFNRVEEYFDDVDDKNQVSIFNILKSIADDINSTLGNVNNIEPVIDKETNTVKFIEQSSIPNLSEIANNLGIPFVDRNTLPSLEIFGYDTVTPNQKGQSTFVRKAGITTSITKEYATIISIGATANGAIPGAESTAFSKWNIGIKDRFKNELIDGEAKRGDNIKKQNDEVINKYNIFCSKPFKKLGFIQNTNANFMINDDVIEVNKNRVQNFYIYAQIENSKKDGHSIESSIGFLPFNLKLEMDGLSGFRIYNRVKVNTSFLPSNYGNTLDFIVTGVNHRLSNNEWVTDLETIATTKDMTS